MCRPSRLSPEWSAHSLIELKGAEELADAEELCSLGYLVSTELRARARDIINRRRRRGDFFPVAIFDEIGWEILLTLYAFDEPIHTAAFVAQGLQSPPSTSQRWIDYLISQQLVIRFSDAEKHPATAIRLTLKGRHRIENYLAGLTPRT